MSDDGKKNPRDNVSPKLKPKDVKNENVAPPGHMGVSAYDMGMTPSGNVKVLRMTVDVAVQDTEQSPEPTEQQAEVEDTRPIAIATGDPEIDAQSEADGFRLMSKEEINAQSGVDENDQSIETDAPENSFDEMMQSDGSTHFERTNDRQVNKHFEERGEIPVPKSLGYDVPDSEGPYDRPRGTPEQLKEAFERAATNSNEVLKSQEQEQG